MKALVHAGVWSSEVYFWHKGQKLSFNKLPEARAEALRLGYDGIRVTSERVAKPMSKPIR